MMESTNNLFETDLLAVLEGILFVSPVPVSLNQLAVFLGRTTIEIENGVHALEELYQQHRGLSIQWQDGHVQMTTAPFLGELVERYLGLETTYRLSRAALETLAIVAYQQPITRPQIDAIRGVNSDGVLKNLLGKGLIQEMGRTDSPGRPIMYGTTADFLHYFGISSLNQLPQLEAIVETMDSASQEHKLLKE